MVEILLVVVLVFSLYVIALFTSMWKLQRERPEGIDRWEFVNRRKGSWNWVCWTTKRYFYTLKTILLGRVISAHSWLLKAGFAVGLAVIAYSLSNDSGVVAAATVFYASLLFLEDRFSYAAILPSDRDTTRLRTGNNIDSAHCEIELVNKGTTIARHIEAEAELIDPVRKNRISLRNVDIGNSEITSLEPKLSRTFTCTFEPGDGMISKLHRYKFDDQLGSRPWIAITIRTPDAVSPTHIYQPLPNSQTKSLEALEDNLQNYSKMLKQVHERV